MPRSTRSPRLLFVAFVVLLALVAASCGDDDAPSADDATETTEPADTTTTSTTLPGTTAPIPEEGQALVDLQLSVVEFGDAGFVELANVGDDDAELSGVHLGQDTTYVDLATVVDDSTVAAGGTVQVPADAIGGLDVAGGEVALFNGPDTAAADAMMSYVQWGEGGFPGAAVATEAGLWPSPDATVTPDPAFNNIESGGFPADPENWS